MATPTDHSNDGLWILSQLLHEEKKNLDEGNNHPFAQVWKYLGQHLTIDVAVGLAQNQSFNERNNSATILRSAASADNWSPHSGIKTNPIDVINTIHEYCPELTNDARELIYRMHCDVSRLWCQAAHRGQVLSQQDTKSWVIAYYPPRCLEALRKLFKKVPEGNLHLMLHFAESAFKPGQKILGDIEISELCRLLKVPPNSCSHARQLYNIVKLESAIFWHDDDDNEQKEAAFEITRAVMPVFIVEECVAKKKGLPLPDNGVEDEIKKCQWGHMKGRSTENIEQQKNQHWQQQLNLPQMKKRENRSAAQKKVSFMLDWVEQTKKVDPFDS